MTGNKYLADTNAFIYLLQKNPSVRSVLESEWAYSFITEIELLGKPKIKEEEIKLVKQMLSVADKLLHVDSINEIAILLKQKYSLKTPDAIIAATALYYKLPLLTADLDFVKIKDLNIILIESN